MTLKEQMALDVDVFVNPDEFGVTCILTLNGADKSINVILDKAQEPETGLFIDVVSAKLSDIEGLRNGDVFTIEGMAYHTVSSKPLFEDGIIATIRVEPA